jgi:uncharacterized membrane protein (UPF0127 family)
MWFPKIRSVHTFRMQFGIDVAHVDSRFRVLRVEAMGPGRLGPWIRRSAGVLEATSGSFDTWGLAVGSQLEFAP